ncbi:unnamed protein product [Amoebophrya sp. A120]|nr:unnamed protein product [Amoebophrya sp. A120]|eukprot:GSA120T00009795001.1
MPFRLAATATNTTTMAALRTESLGAPSTSLLRTFFIVTWCCLGHSLSMKPKSHDHSRPGILEPDLPQPEEAKDDVDAGEERRNFAGRTRSLEDVENNPLVVDGINKQRNFQVGGKNGRSGDHDDHELVPETYEFRKNYAGASSSSTDSGTSDHDNLSPAAALQLPAEDHDESQHSTAKTSTSSPSSRDKNLVQQDDNPPREYQGVDHPSSSGENENDSLYPPASNWNLNPRPTTEEDHIQSVNPGAHHKDPDVVAFLEFSMNKRLGAIGGATATSIGGTSSNGAALLPGAGDEVGTRDTFERIPDPRDPKRVIKVRVQREIVSVDTQYNADPKTGQLTVVLAEEGRAASWDIVKKTRATSFSNNAAFSREYALQTVPAYFEHLIPFRKFIQQTFGNNVQVKPVSLRERVQRDVLFMDAITNQWQPCYTLTTQGDASMMQSSQLAQTVEECSEKVVRAIEKVVQTADFVPVEPVAPGSLPTMDWDGSGALVNPVIQNIHVQKAPAYVYGTPADIADNKGLELPRETPLRKEKRQFLGPTSTWVRNNLPGAATAPKIGSMPTPMVVGPTFQDVATQLPGGAGPGMQPAPATPFASGLPNYMQSGGVVMRMPAQGGGGGAGAGVTGQPVHVLHPGTLMHAPGTSTGGSPPGGPGTQLHPGGVAQQPPVQVVQLQPLFAGPGQAVPGAGGGVQQPGGTTTAPAGVKITAPQPRDLTDDLANNLRQSSSPRTVQAGGASVPRPLFDSTGALPVGDGGTTTPQQQQLNGGVGLSPQQLLGGGIAGGHHGPQPLTLEQQQLLGLPGAGGTPGAAGLQPLAQQQSGGQQGVLTQPPNVQVVQMSPQIGQPQLPQQGHPQPVQAGGPVEIMLPPNLQSTAGGAPSVVLRQFYNPIDNGRGPSSPFEIGQIVLVPQGTTGAGEPVASQAGGPHLPTQPHRGPGATLPLTNGLPDVSTVAITKNVAMVPTGQPGGRRDKLGQKGNLLPPPGGVGSRGGPMVYEQPVEVIHHRNPNLLGPAYIDDGPTAPATSQSPRVLSGGSAGGSKPRPLAAMLPGGVGGQHPPAQGGGAAGTTTPVDVMMAPAAAPGGGLFPGGQQPGGGPQLLDYGVALPLTGAQGFYNSGGPGGAGGAATSMQQPGTPFAGGGPAAQPLQWQVFSPFAQQPGGAAPGGGVDHFYPQSPGVVGGPGTTAPPGAAGSSQQLQPPQLPYHLPGSSMTAPQPGQPDGLDTPTKQGGDRIALAGGQGVVPKPLQPLGLLGAGGAGGGHPGSSTSTGGGGQQLPGQHMPFILPPGSNIGVIHPEQLQPGQQARPPGPATPFEQHSLFAAGGGGPGANGPLPLYVLPAGGGPQPAGGGPHGGAQPLYDPTTGLLLPPGQQNPPNVGGVFATSDPGLPNGGADLPKQGGDRHAQMFGGGGSVPKPLTGGPGQLQHLPGQIQILQAPPVQLGPAGGAGGPQQLQPGQQVQLPGGHQPGQQTGVPTIQNVQLLPAAQQPRTSSGELVGGPIEQQPGFLPTQLLRPVENPAGPPGGAAGFGVQQLPSSPFDANYQARVSGARAASPSSPPSQNDNAAGMNQHPPGIAFAPTPAGLGYVDNVSGGAAGGGGLVSGTSQPIVQIRPPEAAHAGSLLPDMGSGTTTGSGGGTSASSAGRASPVLLYGGQGSVPKPVVNGDTTYMPGFMAAVGGGGGGPAGGAGGPPPTGGTSPQLQQSQGIHLIPLQPGAVDANGRPVGPHTQMPGTPFGSFSPSNNPSDVHSGIFGAQPQPLAQVLLAQHQQMFGGPGGTGAPGTTAPGAGPIFLADPNETRPQLPHADEGTSIGVVRPESSRVAEGGSQSKPQPLSPQVLHNLILASQAAGGGAGHMHHYPHGSAGPQQQHLAGGVQHPGMALGGPAPQGPPLYNNLAQPPQAALLPQGQQQQQQQLQQQQPQQQQQPAQGGAAGTTTITMTHVLPGNNGVNIVNAGSLPATSPSGQVLPPGQQQLAPQSGYSVSGPSQGGGAAQVNIYQAPPPQELPPHLRPTQPQPLEPEDGGITTAAGAPLNMPGAAPGGGATTVTIGSTAAPVSVVRPPPPQVGPGVVPPNNPDVLSDVPGTTTVVETTTTNPDTGQPKKHAMDVQDGRHLLSTAGVTALAGASKPGARAVIAQSLTDKDGNPSMVKWVAVGVEPDKRSAAAAAAGGAATPDSPNALAPPRDPAEVAQESLESATEARHVDPGKKVTTVTVIDSAEHAGNPSAWKTFSYAGAQLQKLWQGIQDMTTSQAPAASAKAASRSNNGRGGGGCGGGGGGPCGGGGDSPAQEQQPRRSAFLQTGVVGEVGHGEQFLQETTAPSSTTTANSASEEDGTRSDVVHGQRFISVADSLENQVDAFLEEKFFPFLEHWSRVVLFCLAAVLLTSVFSLMRTATEAVAFRYKGFSTAAVDHCSTSGVVLEEHKTASTSCGSCGGTKSETTLGAARAGGNAINAATPATTIERSVAKSSSSEEAATTTSTEKMLNEAGETADKNETAEELVHHHDGVGSGRKLFFGRQALSSMAKWVFGAEVDHTCGPRQNCCDTSAVEQACSGEVDRGGGGAPKPTTSKSWMV